MQRRHKKMKNMKDVKRHGWLRKPNICLVRVLEGREAKNGSVAVFGEIRDKNFPNYRFKKKSQQNK